MKITIGKKEFEAKERILFQNELLFYEENPRIYSIINSDGNMPSQEGIEEILTTMDHVKQLKVSIEQNGGIIDPLIVLKKKDSYTVLEGNSRLAAYRILAKKNPSKWKEVKCTVLSEDITDDDIFTLLGQYHLIGRKDWSKFEQASYLFRKKHTSKLDNDILAQSIGLPTPTVVQYLRIYNFMRDHNDLRPDKWSYYDEYLKNRGIKKYRDTSPKIDEIFVAKVKTGEIKQAVDVRNQLGTLAKGTDKTAKRLMQELINGKISLDDAHDRYESTGKTGGAYLRVKKVLLTFVDDDFQKKVKIEAASTRDMAFQLKKIKLIVEKLLRDIGE